MFLLSMQTGLIDMKLPQRYSIVKDRNVDLGVIFSSVQNWSTIKAVCTKIPKSCLFHYFDISEGKYRAIIFHISGIWAKTNIF